MQNLSIPFLVPQVGRGLFNFFMGGFLYFFVYLGKSPNIRSRRSETFALIAIGIVLFTFLLRSIFTVRGIDIFGNKHLYFIMAISPAILILTLSFHLVTTVLSFRPIAWLGDISYSIYLWHFPIEVALVVLDKVFGAEINFSSESVFCMRFAITMAVAVVSHYYFEPLVKKIVLQISEKEISNM